MRKLFFAAILIACASSFTFAQTSASSVDKNKYDFYVGYSYDNVDTGDDRESFHGVEAFGKYNFSRYVGAVADYSFHRKSFNETFGTTTITVDTNLNTLMGGVELKDNNKETKVKPFARALVGFQNARAHDNIIGFSDSETGVSAAIGGGIDFRISPRVDFRAIQVDYNPTHLDGGTQHNIRVGVGIIFR